MPFFKSLPGNAGPPNVFKQYPDIYGPFSEMSQALMNGPSPLSPAEREMILAYAAGVMNCQFVLTGHSEVAYAWGVERGTIEALLDNIETAPVEARLKPLFQYVKTLAIEPNAVTQEDIDAVLDAGWEEQALQDAIAITARAAFMHRLVAGHGFSPLAPQVAQEHAQKRVKQGYVNLYRVFRKNEPTSS